MPTKKSARKQREAEREMEMAFNGVTLLALLLACCLFVPTLARNLNMTQRSFVQSEDANSDLASKQQGPISSFAETGHAKRISVLSVLRHEENTPIYETGPEENLFLHETGHEDIIPKSASHSKPELSVADEAMSVASEVSMSTSSLLRAEDLSSSHDIEMALPSPSHTEDILHYESEFFLHDDDTIPSLLDQNGLPIGLLPSSVASYSITDGGEFTVSLQKACYVKFDYEVYYAETITGKLSYGTITDLSGIQAKEAFFWVPVTGIRTDIPSSEYIYFDVGPISKKLSISQFETIPVCKVKAVAFSALA